VAAFLVAFGDAAKAGLVTNGGFELGGTGFPTCSLSGWTPSGNIIHTGVSSDGSQHSGSCYAYIGASLPTTGYIYQDLATAVGASYDITLWLRTGNDELPTAGEVDWGGVKVWSVSNWAITDWTLFTIPVAATSTQTTLTLGFSDTPSYFYLDDIDVNSSVPEPSTFLVGLPALALLILRRWK
jgi:hypothetical protein